ncbi:MAG: Holliday junction branch migration protein RuvA [Parachlamydiales bacterium]|jgi:Holliday junction DNA helicase RuvA
MFEYIKGKLIEADNQKAIVDVNGLGYKIFIPACISSSLLDKTEVLLYISYIVKEDSQTLYGFLTKVQKEVFELLMTVSGVGAKTANLLLGHLDVENLHLAISNADIRILSKVPGIGKKTAERLIVDLRDKIKTIDKSSLPASYPNGSGSIAFDAIAALMNLGYNANQAQKAVKTAMQSFDDKVELSSLITKALQNI